MNESAAADGLASVTKLQHFFVEITLKGALLPEELAAQREFLQQLTGRGALIAAGVLPDIRGRGIAILLAASLAEARATYATAPVVVAGKASVEVNSLRITAGLSLR